MIEVTEYDMNEASPLERDVIRSAGSVLSGTYPHVSWDVSFEQGVLKVQCPELYEFKNRNHGFVVHYAKIASDSEWKKKLVMTGGELLERAGMRRDRDLRDGTTVDHTGEKKVQLL